MPDFGISRTASLTTRGGSLRVRERREHGIAEAAFGPVILDRHEPPARRLGCCAERLLVDRLDRVEVDDARGDPFLGERVGRSAPRAP